ncbi:hypothetical protein BS17DRAFT_789750 [Gyrodon lividus]|nr:hypothetical protein BS17DRAFT_789750 [Gyrodon lividus]
MSRSFLTLCGQILNYSLFPILYPTIPQSHIPYPIFPCLDFWYSLSSVTSRNFPNPFDPIPAPYDQIPNPEPQTLP